jgi:hypothetical protein
MGLEPLIWGLWVTQAIAGVILALRAAVHHRWFAATGTILGLVIGFSPYFVMQGRAVWGPIILIATLSTIVLTLVYSIAMRWKPLILVLLLLTLPLGYRILLFETYPPNLNPPLLEPLAFIGETIFLLSPITCALATKEVLGLLDRFIAIRRSA